MKWRFDKMKRRFEMTKTPFRFFDYSMYYFN